MRVGGRLKNKGGEYAKKRQECRTFSAKDCYDIVEMRGGGEKKPGATTAHKRHLLTRMVFIPQ